MTILHRSAPTSTRSASGAFLPYVPGLRRHHHLLGSSQTGAMMWVVRWLALAASVLTSCTAALLVILETRSVTLLAAALASATVSSVYGAPLAQSWMNRSGASRVALVALIGGAVVAVILSQLAALDIAQHLLIAVIAVLAMGYFAALGAQTLQHAPRTAGWGAAPRRWFSTLRKTVEYSPTVLGPVLAAWLWTVTPASIIFLLSASVYAVAAVLLVRSGWLHSDHVDDVTPTAPLTPYFLHARAGWRFIRRHTALMRLQVGATLLNICNGWTLAAAAAYVVLSTQAAGESPAWALGLTRAAMGIGLLVGAWGITRVLHRGDRRVWALGSLLLCAVAGRWLLGLTDVVWVFVLAYLVRNVFAQAMTESFEGVWRESVHTSHRAAVHQARALLGQGMFPAAVILGGFVTDVLGARLGLMPALVWSIIAVAIVEVVVGLWLFADPAVTYQLTRRAGRTNRPLYGEHTHCHCCGVPLPREDDDVFSPRPDAARSW